jgi:hypothetical protein
MVLDDYYEVETIFRKQTYPEYYLTLHAFADALDAHEDFNANRPECVPGGAKFREHVAIMKELGVGADRGDSLLKEQRQAAREHSELDMDASVSYARILAIEKKDPTILHTLSLPLKESHPKSVRRLQAQQQSAEIHVSVKHLKGVSGAIVIEAVHVRNGGPYQVQLCKGEPTSEENWENLTGHYKSCSKIILRNLEPANRYYVRMRTDGPEGPGPWSHAVSIIVI